MKVTRVKISELVEDPNNLRVHPEKNLAAIESSLKRFQQVEPLVVQRRTKVVIGGNGRLFVMRQLGWEECDVVYVDLSEAEAAALSVTLNRTAESAEWNVDELSKQLRSIGKESAAQLGFDAADIAALCRASKATIEEPPYTEPEIV